MAEDSIFAAGSAGIVVSEPHGHEASGRRIAVAGTFRVPLSRDDAFRLFTPRGERAWAHGWDPRFCADSPDDTEPGTVFQTGHDGVTTTWVVTHSVRGEQITYARLTPGKDVGLVAVRCDQAEEATTSVTVRYDLTALAPEAVADLDAFAAGFADYLRGWEQAIARTLASGGHEARARSDE
jgi:hypothetical protein